MSGSTPMPGRERIAWAPILVLGLAKLALHLATYEGYGLFRDELYYLASALPERLAWGYVDHPPLSIALLQASRSLLGESLLATRTLPALAGAATVCVSALVAHALGGGRRAQTLAAIATLTTPFYLAVSHFYSMNAFDVLAWCVLALLATRALTTQDARAWPAFGVAAGLGLLNKVSVGFFGFGLVCGMLLGARWRELTRPGLWIGGALALAIFLPHLLWQVQHDFPTLEFQANAREGKNLALSPLAFAGQQVQMGNPILLPLWAFGLGALLFAARFRAVRALGFVYPVLFLLFVATNGKSYYLAPIYSLLFAAGAVAAEPWLERARWRTPVALGVILLGSLPVAPLALPLLTPEELVAHQERIGMQVPQLEAHAMPALPQSFADMHGWQELVDTVEGVVDSLPEAERARAVVLATNYGEAGALEVIGRDRALPPVACGHNAYWFWRPERLEGPFITLRRSDDELARWFDSVERVATVRCEWCMPYQDESPVHVARGLRIPADQLWAEIRRFQ